MSTHSTEVDPGFLERGFRCIQRGLIRGIYLENQQNTNLGPISYTKSPIFIQLN